ncbi:LegC family aminotransferase [Candidatus Thioglobus sp.]|nr:LegC family aminotransferase [Candidatus Thioglobus sp.]
MIPLCVPNLNGNEWQYVKECLDTEWVSSAGKYVDLFEQKILEYTGAKYAVACINGTAALQVSLRLAGVCQGDEVIVPTLTFIAPVNAIAYNGANPVFMDVDNYYNLDVEKTIEFIQNETFLKDGFSYNKKSNKKIAAIMPVHMWGNPVWLDELIHVCKKSNIAIVEDASESLGSFYNKGKFNRCHTGTVGMMGCISFNGNKIITSGGGGMILTNDNAIMEKARYLTTQAKDDPVRYIHNEIGYNFRLSNIQAALGVAQLEQLPNFVERKRDILNTYKASINGIDGLSIADVPSYAENNHWMVLLQIDKDIYGENREALMHRLDKKNIQTRPAWSPIHLQKPYRTCQTYHIEKADELVDNSLCLPSSTNLENSDLSEVIRALKK